MATATSSNLAGQPNIGCGADCVLLDGVCRCYYGEPVPTAASPTWLNDISLPF